MRHPNIDMHCDTLLRTYKDGAASLFDGKGMLSIRLMKEAGQMAQFFAIFFPPRNLESEKEGEKPAFAFPTDEEFYERLKSNLYQQVEEHQDIIAMARTGEEIEKNDELGLMSAILSIEDGRMINGNMERLKALREDGVCAISLTWNFANCFGYPNSKDPKIMEKGLTDFGKEAILVMNELGIMIDVSHLSDGGFWDVANLSKKPFVATHSNCRAVSPHTRNLTDEMLKALANNGGVCGLNFGPEFLTENLSNLETRVEYLAAQVLHMYQVGGEEVIAFGTDFDGIKGNFEVGKPTQMDLLYDALQKKGMSERVLEKMASKNVLRVMKDCCV